MYLVRFRWESLNAIQGGWVGLMEFDERKVLKFGEKCFELRKQVKVDEKFEFSYLEKFSHSKNLDRIKKLEKSKLNPLSSQKTQVSSSSKIKWYFKRFIWSSRWIFYFSRMWLVRACWTLFSLMPTGHKLDNKES